MESVPWPVAVAVSSALVIAIGALWRYVVTSQRETRAREAASAKASAEREAAAAARCEREIGAAVTRIHQLEERSHGEQRQDLATCLVIIKENTAVFSRLVDLEKTRQTASGPHPTQQH